MARDELEQAGVEFRLRRYLDDPPSEAELRCRRDERSAAPHVEAVSPW
jgi:hypothetical protein